MCSLSFQSKICNIISYTIHKACSSNCITKFYRNYLFMLTCIKFFIPIQSRKVLLNAFGHISMAPSESSVVAEYAKSNRSTCKKCSEAIQSKTLRLGLVTRDKKRGFDVTKWHHLTCFTVPSSHSSIDKITGFSSLKVISFLLFKYFHSVFFVCDLLI